MLRVLGCKCSEVKNYTSGKIVIECILYITLSIVKGVHFLHSHSKSVNLFHPRAD